MNTRCSVYVLTNQKNGKQYVGVSQNPFKRLKQHANPRKKKTRSIITNAINEYGLESFKLKVLLYADRKYCYQLEQKLIDKFKTITPYGYNICRGGLGAVGLYGEHNGMYGRRGSLNPQFGKTGERGAFFGRKHTQETKEKMSASRIGLKRNAESRERIRQASIERWKNPSYREKVMLAKQFNKEIS